MEYKNEIRFALTPRCNFKCVFCHNEGSDKDEKMKEIVTSDDYCFITEVVSRCLGIKEFTLTGGEPLLRSDILEIAKKIKTKDNDVKLITNGVFLSQYSAISGIVDEIHISLGTLDIDEHEKRTMSKGQLSNVLGGIDDVIGAKATIKINIVMINTENEDTEHLEKIMEFCKERFLETYLIEIFPKESPYHMSFSKIEGLLKKMGYVRGKEKGVKVAYFKEGYPKVSVVFVPCSFVASPLVGDPVGFCKTHQSIYIQSDLTSQPCFMKASNRISLLDEVKNRDESMLIRKIKLIRAKIGQDCPLLK